MNAEASSSSHTREHTHLSPFKTQSGSISNQAQELATQKEQEIEDAINLLELRNNQPQTHPRPRTQSQPRTQSRPLPRPNKGPIVDQTRLDLQEGVDVEDKIKLLRPVTDQSQSQPEPGLEKITLEARLAKKDKQLEAARKELRKIEGEKTKLKQEVDGLDELLSSLLAGDRETYKRRFHDLGAESSTSIAKEPERIKFPKRTVLGIIQNQGGTPTDQAKDRQVTEAEKIKLKRRAQARAHISRLDQLERENKRLKATLEKRDGQIKQLVNADKENRNSRHWGSPESREARFRPPPGFHWFS